MSEHKLLFRNTASKKGRHWIITPDNSDLEALGYARIVLDRDVNEAKYTNPDFEAALICLKGSGTVSIGSKTFEVEPYDAIFLPPGQSGSIQTSSELDILESTAPSDQTGDPVFIPFEEVNKDEELTQMLQSPPSQRKLHRIIDDNVPAQRLLCGLDFSKEGNWTSWAPHEHTATKEEIYVYFDMPEPAFGIQLIYEDIENPEFCGPVKNDDAVVIKQGYHPNVSIPGYPINFVWIMATVDADMDRSWADVNTQPEFADY